MQEPRAPSESCVTMTQMVLPGDTNNLGSAFGGTIMAWIDIAAAVAASRHSRGTAVTASIDALSFHAPVRAGSVVILKASVNAVHNTSMEVGVRVEVEDVRTGALQHTASAYLTFVAVDERGQPRKVTPLLPQTEAELRRFRAASRRRQLRLQHREQERRMALAEKAEAELPDVPH